MLTVRVQIRRCVHDTVGHTLLTVAGCSPPDFGQGLWPDAQLTETNSPVIDTSLQSFFCDA